MSGFFAFLFTALQIVGLVLAYFMQWQALFTDLAINGSPFYLIMNLFNNDSAILGGPRIYLAFFVFHIVKYLCIVRAKFVESQAELLPFTIGFEIVYLCVNAYYLY